MARECEQCGKTLGFFEVSDPFEASDPSFSAVLCYACSDENRRKVAETSREESDKTRKLAAVFEAELAEIVLTTETDVDFKVTQRLEIITAECVFGMNIFRDFFAGIRDIAGGRSEATQKVLRDSRKTVLNELRKEAHSIGANAVIGVDLDYSEFSGGGKSMLFLVASGTAVIAELEGAQ